MNTFALAAGLIAVPLIDQAVKFVLRGWLGSGSAPMGQLGAIRLVDSRIWLAWLRPGRNRWVQCGLWLAAAGTLTVVSTFHPGFGWCAGLLLGGSLSHGLESSLRGCVCDYLCLRFWPAFNLADVAITVGAVGTLVELIGQYRFVH